MDGLGLRFLSALYSKNDLKYLSKIKIEWLEVDTRKIYAFIQDHLHKYGQLPSKDTLIRSCDIVLPKHEEPIDYYVEKLFKRYKVKCLGEAFDGAVSSFEKGDIDKAFKLLEDLQTVQIDNLENQGQLVDVAQTLDEDWKIYEEIRDSGGMIGHHTGNAILDEYFGGFAGGDLVLVAGRPNVGKTWKLLSLFHYASTILNQKCLFISPENSLKECRMRFAALRYKFNWTHFSKGRLTTEEEERLKHDIGVEKKLGVKDWWILGVESSKIRSVKDIAMLVKQLNIDVVFVDALYSLGSLKEDMGTRVSNSIIELKRTAITNDIPVIASTQFNRQVHADDSGKGILRAGLHHLGFSDFAGMIPDAVIAIQFCKDLKLQGKMLFELIKNRRNRHVEYMTNWDFDVMDFSLLGESLNGDLVDSEENQNTTGVDTISNSESIPF